MPLGKREGLELCESRFCGVETDFAFVPDLISSNITNGGFDYILTPLMNPTYRPSLAEGSGSVADSPVLPVSASDLVLATSKWRSQVLGKISPWIDLDSEDEVLRMVSEISLKQEIAWATHLSIQTCLLPTPKGTSCANYARCVNQILQETSLQLLLRIPLVKSDGDSTGSTSEDLKDSWELWNCFRLLCEHDSKLTVALDMKSKLPSETSLDRWMGEPVRAVTISTDTFILNSRGYPCLSKRQQKLISRFFNNDVQVIVSGKPVHNLPKTSGSNTKVTQKHPMRSYLEYVAYMYQQMEELPEQERSEIGYRDCLQVALQPLTKNLVAPIYEIFERDAVKYIRFEKAITKALVDRVPDEKVSELTTVLMIVGAGRGPLVKASLKASAETGRMVKVYAVEKNLNAVVTLRNLVKIEGWEAIVKIVSCDVRSWNAPEKVDILVSELMGSFGDNELSPECLDGAQRFLKPDGISIPSSYTSFIQPITASIFYNELKARKELSHFETAYVVKMHSVAKLAPTQSVFTFTHPNLSTKANNNQRYKKLQFNLPKGAGSALVHGFAGYFDCVLYEDIHIGIEPKTATPDLLSWFPMFFPLRNPVEMNPDAPLEVHFWRCCDSSKVWYEWSVTSPTPSPIHNSNGRSYSIGL